MKKLWIPTVILFCIIIASVFAAFYYQDKLVQFCTQHGWGKWAQLAQTPWWSNAASWILALTALIALNIAVWQVVQARKSTNAQMALGLFNQLRSPESLKKLRYIYRKRPEAFLKLKAETLADNIDSIIDILGMIGTLVDNKILDKDLAIKAFGGVTAVRCWY